MFVGGTDTNNKSFLLTGGLRPTTTTLQTFTLPNDDSFNSVAFSKGNTYLAIGDKNGGVYIYQAENDSFK